MIPIGHMRYWQMKELDFNLIGQRIREVRTEKHLTQEALANAVNVNVSHISNIETGKTKISLTLLVAVINTLDVTIDYLLEHEYSDSQSVIENEFLKTIRNMDKDKLEILLRIAKVM